MNALLATYSNVENSLKCFYHLHFSQYVSAMDYPIIVILPCFAACVLFALIFSLSKLPSHSNKPSDSLQALFTVIAPTSVAWPREYARLVNHCTSSRSRSVAISMSSLVASVCDGTVEVRNYADLPELFSDKLVVYGWRFSLALDALGNLEVLRWVVFSHFSWPKPETSKKLKRGLKRAYGTSRPKEDSLPVSIQSLSLTTNTHLDLDYTPFSSLESSLLRLRSTLAPGALASLEFTTPTPSVTFLSTQFTICAVPFMTRKYPGGSGAPNRNRTATPLLASLHRVLELLTAGPAALALESVSNVSQQYADGLTAAAEHLGDDRATRTTLIQQCGMAGWREQRLMMAWEAALFSAGHLSRWVVVVRK